MGERGRAATRDLARPEAQGRDCAPATWDWRACGLGSGRLAGALAEAGDAGSGGAGARKGVPPKGGDGSGSAAAPAGGGRAGAGTASTGTALAGARLQVRRAAPRRRQRAWLRPGAGMGAAGPSAAAAGSGPRWLGCAVARPEPPAPPPRAGVAPCARPGRLARPAAPPPGRRFRSRPPQQAPAPRLGQRAGARISNLGVGRRWLVCVCPIVHGQVPSAENRHLLLVPEGEKKAWTRHVPVRQARIRQIWGKARCSANDLETQRNLSRAVCACCLTTWPPAARRRG